jgi:hypothetical protein
MRVSRDPSMTPTLPSSAKADDPAFPSSRRNREAAAY